MVITMKTITIPKLLVFFLIMFIFIANVFSQSKVGTTIGQFLKIEPSSRAAGMGNASASLSGEAMAAYFNPASLGRLAHSDVQFTHSEWLAGIDFNYAIVALHLRKLGTFSLQATSLNSGEIDVRTVEQPLGTGERYSVTNFSLGAGYGKMLTDRVSVGVQLNYIRETIWHSSASNVGFNLGVQYQLSLNGITMGASVSNFGPHARFGGRDLYIDHDFDPTKYGDNDKLPSELRTSEYALPTIFRFGISYPLKFHESNQLLVAVDALHPSDNNESLNLGVEWQIMNLFTIRSGYRELFLADTEGGLSLGAGMQFGLSGYNFRFDYSWNDYNRLKETHRFTLGFGF